MARRSKTSQRPQMARWLWRGAALVALTGCGFVAWLWWDMREWRPDEATFPEQGAVIASGAGPTRFETIKALGGAFVYLELPDHNGPPDPGFAARTAAAREAGLKVGVVQIYDPCRSADTQSAFLRAWCRAMRHGCRLRLRLPGWQIAVRRRLVMPRWKANW